RLRLNAGAFGDAKVELQQVAAVDPPVSAIDDRRSERQAIQKSRPRDRTAEQQHPSRDEGKAWPSPVNRAEYPHRFARSSAILTRQRHEVLSDRSERPGQPAQPVHAFMTEPDLDRGARCS